MAQPGPSSSTGAGQGAGAAPEAPWLSFIQEHYPHLLKQTHFFPPFHFNRTPHAVATIAGQCALVRDNPHPQRRRKEPAFRQTAPLAGGVFAENSPHSQDLHVPDSDQQDDRATQRCLSALLHLLNQVMMVITSLKFLKYLSNHTNPLHAAAANAAAAVTQLPTVRDPSLSRQIQDGECDVLIIHRHYGLLVGEIKAVGASSHFQSQSPKERALVIGSKVERALKQLQNQETALRRLVSDLPPLRIGKVVMLPNVKSSQLREALDSDAPLLQRLCQVLCLPQDVEEAVRHCLCEEDLQNPQPLVAGTPHSWA